MKTLNKFTLTKKQTKTIKSLIQNSIHQNIRTIKSLKVQIDEAENDGLIHREGMFLNLNLEITETEKHTKYLLKLKKIMKNPYR